MIRLLLGFTFITPAPVPLRALPTIPAAVLPSATIAPSAAREKTPEPLGPPGVLDRYEARCASVRTPAILTFQYTVEQAGERSLTQLHRVYRNGNMERDEVLSLDEARVKPKIRIFRNRPNAYAFEATAPRRELYGFTYVAKVRSGNHVDYVYRTTPLNRLGGFAATGVVIDGQTFLPAAVDFTSVSAPASGKGTLRYAMIDGAWVVTEVEVAAETTKRRLREHFVFTDYHVLKSLPESTFGTM